MKNIDRITKNINKTNADNIMIHTIPENGNWLICQKTEKDTWLITLAHPLGNISYNLGTISEEGHIALWETLVKTKIDSYSSDSAINNIIKDTIYNFKKKYNEKTYSMLIKKYEINDKKVRKKIQRVKNKKQWKKSNRHSKIF